MGNSYSKSKGRRSTRERHFQLPHRFMEHENFIRLTPRAIKLFLDFGYQYNGRNNGDFSAAFSVMKKRGWKSKETLQLALDELLHYGWIIRTRLGGLNKTCNLYGFTFHSIDECEGKLDCKTTNSPLGSWKNKVEVWKKPDRYKAMDTKRKLKAGVRNPYLSSTESVPMALVKG